jgi:hypothetical protein
MAPRMKVNVLYDIIEHCAVLRLHCEEGVSKCKSSVHNYTVCLLSYIEPRGSRHVVSIPTPYAVSEKQPPPPPLCFARVISNGVSYNAISSIQPGIQPEGPDVSEQFSRSVVSLPLPVEDVKERLLFPGAIAAILIATGEGSHQITLLVLPSISVRTGDVGVEQRLRDHGELGEDGAMPSRIRISFKVCYQERLNVVHVSTYCTMCSSAWLSAFWKL